MTVWVKLCGVGSVDRARRLAALEPDALGINRYEPSSRYVDRDHAARLAGVIREENSSVDVVGVYVNASETTLREDHDRIDWDVIQLHGDESPEEVAAAGELSRVMKAFRVDDDFSTDRLDTYDSWSYLLDAKESGRYGGTGRKAPWDVVGGLTDEYRIVLAGGLTPDNVADAVRSTNPWGVDACSGIEDEQGRRDPEKTRRFVEAVRRTTE